MKHFNLITILLFISLFLTPQHALAEIGGLTKCSESPAFDKRLKASVKN